MVDVLKSADNKENKTKETPAVIAETKDTVVVADKPAIQADDELVVTLKKQLSDAEAREKTERDKRIEAEKGREEANTKVASSQGEAIKAHETSIANAIQVATGNISAIKRELQDAIEGGDIAKQLDLQEKLSDARWDYREADKNKKNFETWKEQQKNAPAVQVQNKPKYTASEQAWIDAHPRFETDDEYYEVVAGADAAARRRGIAPDTRAYYDYVEAALKRKGMDDDAQADNGRDTTGSVEEEEEEVVVAPKKKPTLTIAAPASYSAPTNPGGTKRTQQYKLSSEQRDMAHRMFGPNSSHKLSEQEAEQKYAARQLEVRDRRANGEKI